MSAERKWVAPHLVEFDPQLREAFLTLEDYLAELAGGEALTGDTGIFWWDGNGDPNSLPGSALSTARGGDFYIDRITGDTYRLVFDPYTRSLTGAENESRATSGSMWWDGTSDPTNPPAATYRSQDFWLNTTTCDVWRLAP